MSNFWNERYSAQAYAYGKEPNYFFANSLKELEPKGNILLPAEGEGRNAVFAALLGLQVSAFDPSEEGKRKALRLAEENNVTIDYQIGTLDDLQFDEKSFDHIGLIFAHFTPPVRSRYHSVLMNLLKPGGCLILQGYSRSHQDFQKTNPTAGGPQNIDMLFTEDLITRDFSELEIISLKQEEVSLSEGLFHQGPSSVVSFVGKKKDV